MTNNERRQHRSVFYQAGQHAFLIGVPASNNPYKDMPYRESWDKGHRNAASRYRTVNRHFAEVKLAALLGTQPPQRQFVPRYNTTARTPAARPQQSQRPQQRPSLQQKFTRAKSHGSFTVGR